MESLKKYGITFASVLLAILMLFAGSAKLAGVPELHISFAVLGLPVWFGYFIGACEVAGAIGLLIRPLSALAALGIFIIMVGAVYFHLVYTPISQTIPSLLILIVSGLIFYKRREYMLVFKK